MELLVFDGPWSRMKMLSPGIDIALYVKLLVFVA